MTYEEKLEKIVSKLKDERDLTRKGRKTKVTFNDQSFTKVRIKEICKILLQLQDDETALKILDALQPLETVPTEQIINPTDNDDYEGVEVITVELDEAFDQWYENYLMGKKTDLENLDFINMLRIYDVVLDINEQIQLTHETKVAIHLLPSLIRFNILFPGDTIGMRDKYCEARWDSLKYLKEKGVIESFDHNSAFHRWDTIVTVILTLSRFDAFYKSIQEEYKRHNQQTPNDQYSSKKIDKSTLWPDDFVWQGNDFVFGQYGKASFTSKDRRHILRVLADKKGNWATISELKGNKDDSYVRATISQIEKNLPDKVKKKLTIISTQDEESDDKPKVGAYRIKLLS